LPCQSLPSLHRHRRILSCQAVFVAPLLSTNGNPSPVLLVVDGQFKVG
jgi:hypothetical protein